MIGCDNRSCTPTLCSAEVCSAEMCRCSAEMQVAQGGLVGMGDKWINQFPSSPSMMDVSALFPKVNV